MAFSSAAFDGMRQATPHDPSAVSQVAQPDLRRSGRPRAYHADLAQRFARGSRSARLFVFRAARHRQDQHGAHPGESAQLHGAGRSAPLQPVPHLHRHQRRAHARPDRDRRGQQQQCRGHPRTARQGRFPAQRRPLQDLHHRRSAYVKQPGVQRPAEDVGGAAAAHALRPGDHGAAQDPRHRSQPLPALRLPPHPRAGDRGAPAPHRRRRAYAATRAPTATSRAQGCMAMPSACSTRCSATARTR